MYSLKTYITLKIDKFLLEIDSSFEKRTLADILIVLMQLCKIVIPPVRYVSSVNLTI